MQPASSRGLLLVLLLLLLLLLLPDAAAAAAAAIMLGCHCSVKTPPAPWSRVSQAASPEKDSSLTAPSAKPAAIWSWPGQNRMHNTLEELGFRVWMTWEG
jgi:predicted MFS family arabinose efflux permease